MKFYNNYFIFTFILLLFCTTYVHQQGFRAPTPVSRLNLLYSIALHGRIDINRYHYNTSDKAIYNNNYYSDKAPGTVVIALIPVAFACTILELCGIEQESESGWLVSSWIGCVGSIGIVTALGGVAMLSWLSKYVPRIPALITTLSIYIGSVPLPYATMMFSHAHVVGLLSIALWAIDKGNSICDKDIASNRTSELINNYIQHNRWLLLAGVACGLSIASEFSSGIMAIGIMFWGILIKQNKCAPVVISATVPLMLIPIYSWACFGNPFTLAYSYQATFTEMKEGIYAIKWPDGPTALKLLFSPSRGLLFWTPFLVMSIVGYSGIWREHRNLFWYALSMPVLQILIMSGRVWDWPAGPTLGPRLLAPLLPWIALPCSYGVVRMPNTGMFLGTYSIIIITLGTLTDACPSFNQHANPLITLHIPSMLQGDISYNLGLVVGMSPHVSCMFYYAVIILGVIRLWKWRDTRITSI